MEEVIKKWELILEQDKDRDITYGRKVLEEMLTDMKMAVKNCSIPHVSGSLPTTKIKIDKSKCAHTFKLINEVFRCNKCKMTLGQWMESERRRKAKGNDR